MPLPGSDLPHRTALGHLNVGGQRVLVLSALHHAAIGADEGQLSEAAAHIEHLVPYEFLVLFRHAKAQKSRSRGGVVLGML